MEGTLPSQDMEGGQPRVHSSLGATFQGAQVAVWYDDMCL